MKFSTVALTASAAIIGTQAATMRAAANAYPTPAPSVYEEEDNAGQGQYEGPKPCNKYDEVEAMSDQTPEPMSEPAPEPETIALADSEPVPTLCPNAHAADGSYEASGAMDYPAPAPAPAQYDGKSQYTEYHSSASKPAVIAAFVISTIAFAL